MSSRWMMLAAALWLLAGVGIAGAQTTQGSSAAASSTGSKVTTQGGAPQPATQAAPQSGAPAVAPATQPPAETAVEAKGRAPKQKISAPPKEKLININAASKAELKSLPGGSDEEAEKIIAGRPYKSKSFLVEDKIIPMGRYIEIKKMIVAGDSSKKTAPAKK